MNKNKVMNFLKQEVKIDTYKYLIGHPSKSGLTQGSL